MKNSLFCICIASHAHVLSQRYYALAHSVLPSLFRSLIARSPASPSSPSRHALGAVHPRRSDGGLRAVCGAAVSVGSPQQQVRPHRVGLRRSAGGQRGAAQAGRGRGALPAGLRRDGDGLHTDVLRVLTRRCRSQLPARDEDASARELHPRPDRGLDGPLPATTAAADDRHHKDPAREQRLDVRRLRLAARQSSALSGGRGNEGLLSSGACLHERACRERQARSRSLPLCCREDGRSTAKMYRGRGLRSRDRCRQSSRHGLHRLPRWRTCQV